MPNVASVIDDLKFLRIDHVLECVPVSRCTLYRMIKAGQFPPPCRLGQTSLWPLTDVRAWARKMTRRDVDDLI